jgi:hypothetical protein
MPVIPINDIAPWTQEIATNLQTVFDTNWTADALTDVVVYSRASAAIDADDALQIVSTADYVASFVLPNSYVRITFIPGKERATGNIVTIMRNTPADRLNMYINTNFQPTMLNGDFNRLLMMIQQRLLTDNQLAVKYNNSDTLNVPPGTKYIADNLLPRLPPLHGWMKNEDNTAIIAAPFGGTGTSITVIINQPNHGFAVNDVVYSNAGVFALANAVNSAEAEVVGMVTDVLSANDFDLLVAGRVDSLAGLTPGGVYFLSETVPGELTLVQPTTIGAISKPLLIATDADTGFFFNMRGKIIEAPGNGASHLVLTQPGHGFTVEQVVYLDGANYALANADAVPTAEAVGIVTTVIDVNSFVVSETGYVSTFAGKTPGDVYFLSDVTPGLLTTVEPTTAGHVSKPMFIAATATAGWILEFRGKIIPDEVWEGTPFNTQMVANKSYYTTGGGTLEFTLPVTSAAGSIIEIAGIGSLGWRILQNAGQNIELGNVISTVGVGGSVESTDNGDTIRLLCTTANTVWVMLSCVTAGFIVV